MDAVSLSILSKQPINFIETLYVIEIGVSKNLINGTLQ